MCAMTIADLLGGGIMKDFARLRMSSLGDIYAEDVTGDGSPSIDLLRTATPACRAST
jgi:hypothetical protein